MILFRFVSILLGSSDVLRIKMNFCMNNVTNRLRARVPNKQCYAIGVVTKVKRMRTRILVRFHVRCLKDVIVIYSLFIIA